LFDFNTIKVCSFWFGSFASVHPSSSSFLLERKGRKRKINWCKSSVKKTRLRSVAHEMHNTAEV